ncbi:MAG: SDR family NAD(P)-dependent oxidoreductase [Anaerolineae bacterium]|nr:SDR family NAD(P)-dependent oxidoreductase [Anaerolineae bacterium]
MNDSANRAVAIVGVGAILPDAPSAAHFWQNIVTKRYSISDVPSDRWAVRDYYDPDPKAPDKTYSKIGGWVRGFDFDWKRFRMPPKVAAAMDQGQQWAVTIAADALADYGYPERPLDTDRTAVIIGTAMGGELHYLTALRIAFPEYARALEQVSEFNQLPKNVREVIMNRWHEILDGVMPPVTEDSMPGELPNIVSGRVANVLDLRGPNFITDAACAGSLAALTTAIEMLTEHQVDAVLTGGVDRNMGVSTFVKFCKIGALSATGSRPFGDGADGFVMGEGAGIFLLKRLEDAERNGDKIYAVIRGVGGSSDGKGKGITAPNPIGQVLAISRAWESAQLDPASAGLVEAHGTSTRVGDVVEVESLAKVFGGAKTHSIGLGSAKSNIGHLKAGAGAAGLLKATMALYHKVLPPTLNSERHNPNIDFAHSPFQLIHDTREWQKNGTPRRAGVSAYGFGGTNFHVVLEEHIPGLLTQPKQYQGASVPQSNGSHGTKPAVSTNSSSTINAGSNDAPVSERPAQPIRGILALGADTPKALVDKLADVVKRVEAGWMPPFAFPKATDLQAPERLVIDYGTHEELLARLHTAQKAAGTDNPSAWRAFTAQGIFRGSGSKPGKIAFMFPGQGSQYVNMGRELAKVSPIVQQVFADADAVMTPILGKPLTSYIFVDSTDPSAMMQAEIDLMQTAITQPAMLTLDTALYALLRAYGFDADVVLGHSLGEYAALIAAGIMPFAHALEAAAARGSEMSKVSVGDNGKMAAIIAPYAVIEEKLKEIDGYVVPANINSRSQCVIGGSSDAVEQAVALFEKLGYQALLLPVSHAFHTRIVAPASDPLRVVLNRLDIQPPKLPIVSNVTGDFYPTDVEAIKDLLQLQIASPVQWVAELETLYDYGVRTFIEVGPKRALRGFAEDVFGSQVLALMTNHPKNGELPSFNQAICGLYAAGYYTAPVPKAAPAPVQINEPQQVVTMTQQNPSLDALSQLLAQALQGQQAAPRRFDRNDPPTGSVVITGTGLGLPGADKPVMAEDNALRILRGEQFVDLIPERFRKAMLDKRITRLVKSADGSGHFETINSPDEVIRLAGRGGTFDLADEYGVPSDLIDALDITTQLAMAAGLDALREAGIPLVQTYRKTTTGKYLPDRWVLPASLRDETGVIFASAFPGGDRFVQEFQHYFEYRNRMEQLAMLDDLRNRTDDPRTLREIKRHIDAINDELTRNPYEFDRRFVFRILAMGHSQFAQYIGARGANTHVNAACASTTQAIALAEDWIRAGRVRRVIVIAADDVTDEHLMEWIGAGFLALGAAATDDRVDEAALPFDRRRHGTLLGMGAAAMVIESEDAARERGMRGIVEVLATESSNSAFHGSRLDVEHITQVMEHAVSAAERRFGINRYAMAEQLVFMSHETFTPARGGSASAEVFALRQTFGEAADSIVVANTKGFTGHPMGVGIEDVIAAKILEYGIVPPIPNYKEVDPDLGTLNFSRGGRYPVNYALHLAAGFGSQIAFSLTRRIPGALDRVDNKPLYQQWLDQVSGYEHAVLEVEKRVLRIVAQGSPNRQPAPSQWQYGTAPTVRTNVSADQRYAPVPAAYSQPVDYKPTYTPPPAPVAPRLEPTPKPISHGNGKVQAEPVEPVTITRVEVAPEPVQPAPVASPAPVSATTVDTIAAQVLEVVAAQTGYPTDMLDLDLDLEADLGIDTVKQAETFAAIRTAFDIPRQDNVKLREYNTLAKVIGFVKSNRPDLVQAAPAAPPQTSAAPVQAAPAPVTAPTVDTISAQVLAIVAEQTGYPTDMLDLDLSVEAGLGNDTVTQAETFPAIRTAFDIPRQDNIKLREYNTLARVIGFVKTNRPDLVVAAPAVITQSVDVGAHGRAPLPETPASVNAPAIDTIAAQVLQIVANQTGYPTDMLDLDLDLEADLGIDTVKQAETFAAIRTAFEIPRQDNIKLRDYNTLAKVIGFVKTNRPDLAEATSVNPKLAAGSTDKPVTPRTATLKYSVEDADKMPRRVPTASLRPALEFCKPTGVQLDASSRVIVALDQGGVGKALVSRLEKRGVTVLTIEDAPPSEALLAQINEWLAQGAITGVYWLLALDVEPNLNDMDLPLWRELNRQRVKNLSITMRALYNAISEAGTFLVSATRLGGKHGYSPEGATAPLGGGVVGFTKAYKRERPDALVKAVDFEISRKTAGLADTLIAETLVDPGVVEIGYADEMRYTVTLIEQPAQDGQAGLTFDQNTVFVVTGAAGGITSAIVEDLATASGGVFYLLDLVKTPSPNDPHIRLFRQGRDALKAALIEEAKAAGEKPTPVMIDKRVMSIERDEAALRAIEAVANAGGTPIYRSVNLLDGAAVTAVVDEIRQQYGRIDALVHAGGLEISRALSDKDAAQFDLVFDVKADGFFSLLNAAKDLPIGATVAFSSVAGRFGNNGQTDYSAANDLLCKISSSFRNWRPNTRGIAIDWTAWGGIGMATRGSIPKIMEMAGIEMLPPESGIPTVRRELVAGGFKGEIVVGGKLGVLVDEWDADGGLDAAKLTALAREKNLLMIGEVKAAKIYGGIEVETTLDPNVQPFLYDHALEGTPLLPGVMGTETFAELASLIAPDYHVIEVSNVSFEAPFKFYRLEPATLILNARITPDAAGGLLAYTQLRSIRQSKAGVQEKTHFTAQVRLNKQPLDQPTIAFTPPTALPITAQQVYQIYFHGDAYQVIEGAGVQNDTAITLLRANLPPNSVPAHTAAIMQPRLIELLFQTAGVWQISTKGEMALPMAVESVSAHRVPDGSERLYGLIEATDGKFNGLVVGESGAVYVSLKGYRTVALPGTVKFE